MQTLPFLSSQTTQKSLTDIANKNDSNINKSSMTQPNASAEKTPFQMELNRQARIKQAQAPASNAPPNQMASAKTAPALPASTKNNASAKANAVEDAPQQQADASAASASNLLLSLDKLGVDFSENKAADETAALGAGLPTENNTSFINLMPTTVTTQTPLPNTSEDLMPKLSESNRQKSLDVALGNALTKGQAGNSLPKDVGDDMADDSARWVDKSFADKAVITSSSDAGTSKLMLNALKEVSAKEVMTVTPQPQLASSLQSLQATAQINASLVSQQIASGNTIYATLGKTGWDQAIGQKVMWMVGAGAQTASLTLNPPDLGPLQVVIHVHNNQADATFISDSDQVRQALESGLAHLREKMGEAGIQLGQTNINSSHQSQQNFQQSSQNRGFMSTQNTSDEQQVESSVKTNTQVKVNNGLVDTFA